MRLRQLIEALDEIEEAAGLDVTVYLLDSVEKPVELDDVYEATKSNGYFSDEK